MVASIGCSLFWGRLCCFKTIIPDSQEHPLATSEHCPDALLRWIRAKAACEGTASKYAQRSRRVGNSSEAIARCTGTRYNPSMIRSFRHRGLRRLYERGDPSRVGADQLDRITLALADLDAASKPSDVDLPGYRLHPLRGDLEGLWSISISGNWRITFRFEDGDAYDVDLVDYH